MNTWIAVNITELHNEKKVKYPFVKSDANRRELDRWEQGVMVSVWNKYYLKQDNKQPFISVNAALEYLKESKNQIKDKVYFVHSESKDSEFILYFKTENYDVTVEKFSSIRFPLLNSDDTPFQGKPGCWVKCRSYFSQTEVKSFPEIVKFDINQETPAYDVKEMLYILNEKKPYFDDDCKSIMMAYQSQCFLVVDTDLSVWLLFYYNNTVDATFTRMRTGPGYANGYRATEHVEYLCNDIKIYTVPRDKQLRFYLKQILSVYRSKPVTSTPRRRA